MIILPCAGVMYPVAISERNEVLRQDQVPHDQQLKDGRCVGSSHGWLIFVLNEFCMYMHHPTARSRLYLPSQGLPPQLHSATKVVLSGEPSRNNSDCVIVVIHGYGSNIAYFDKGGLERRWIDLQNAGQMICDVIFHEDRLYALYKAGNIGVWEFGLPRRRTHPLQYMEIQATYPPGAFETWRAVGDRCTVRGYLVKSPDSLLLIWRSLGEFVRDGVPIYESELVEEGSNCPPIFPYSTLDFIVHKLNSDDYPDKWEAVDSIGDNVIFIGGSQSICIPSEEVPRCHRNSIYFTDDYWDRMNEDETYGGHDMGWFDMGDRSIKDFYQIDDARIQPPPFWVFPSCYYK